MIRFVVLILFVCLCACQQGKNQETWSVEDVAQVNRAVGLMGRFDYQAAFEQFSQLVTRFPDQPDLKVNLAIATLNRQQEGDEATALTLLLEILTIHPDHARANYCAGLLLVYQGRGAEAKPLFEKVRATLPKEAFTLYQLGQIELDSQQNEAAEALFKEAAELNPYLRSAYYGIFRSARMSGNMEKAREALGTFQKLNLNPRATLFEFKYSRMGPLALVEPVGTLGETDRSAPTGPLFNPDQPVLAAEQNFLPKGATSCDIDGDGSLDLFLVGGGTAEGNPVNRILFLKDDQYVADSDHPLASVAGVNAALWGDFDNDGRTDVYLCRKGPNQLWRNTHQGWVNVTEESASSAGNLNTVAGAIFDADHDGDLDLFLVNRDGPNELLNNNRDGSFRALAADSGLAGTGSASKAVIVYDLDGDRDQDLLIINEQPPHEAYTNDLLWRYRPATELSKWTQSSVTAAVCADLDANGQPELISLTDNGELIRWAADDNGVWLSSKLWRGEASNGPGEIAVFDPDGDTQLDLLVTDSKGWRLINPTRPDSVLDQREVEGLGFCQPYLVEPQRGASLLWYSAKQGLQIAPPGAGRFNFVALTFSGKEDEGASMRSNASGIGTEVAVRIGDRWTMTRFGRNQSHPGQSLQPLAVGLAGQEFADFVAMEWTDGVFQSELSLQKNQLHSITETQRQLASCPVLFAWTGEEFTFVSDVLGVGGIGFEVGKGEYGEPRPWETYHFAHAPLAPKDGRYRIKIGEPMEEVSYLDHVSMVGYELPKDWQLVVDDRFAIGGPQPTGKPMFYRLEMTPDNATNERGEQVSQLLQERDLKAAPIGAKDHRFLGRLNHHAEITLTFPVAFEEMDGKPVLVIDGWVEYPYSQTMFAAWQAKAAYEAPSLWAQGRDGRWVEVIHQFGYPAGMPRRMGLPLPDLPPGTQTLRLRTNMEIYWDRIAVAFVEENAPVRRLDLPLVEARLLESGFAKRTTGEQMQPHYNYNQRTPFWDTRHQSGFYTRLGDVMPLLVKQDDALAIFGPGEEVDLAFEAPPKQTLGNKLHLTLEMRGWCKDMDLYTKDGKTIEPLPASGKDPATVRALHDRFNTRFRAGY